MEIEELTRILPEGWEEKAKELGAITRSRKIKTATDLLSLVLLHGTVGESYGRTAAMTQVSDGLKLTKNAVFERFEKSGKWLAWLCENISRNAGILSKKPCWLEGRRVCLVDATDESEKGSNKADWRLHYMMELFTLDTLETHLTKAETGEKMENFIKFKEGDIVIADRAYGTAKSINYCLQNEVDYCIRFRSNGFNVYDGNGTKIMLEEELSGMSEGESREFNFYRKYDENPVPIRFCVYRKTSEQSEKSIRHIIRNNSKKVRGAVSEKQEFFGKFVIIATSLTDDCEKILELYRMRWQIELLFKRLKSIFEYDKMPVKNEATIRAWFNGKLLLAAICEALVNEGRFSPETQI
jgi:hypothetical protein